MVCPACAPSSGLPQRRSLPAPGDRQKRVPSHRCRHGAVHQFAAGRHVIAVHWILSYRRLSLQQLSHHAPRSLPRYYGPIALKQIPGKGRGLVALGDLAPGDLVLVSLPAAVVFNDGDSGGDCGRPEGTEDDSEGDDGEPRAHSVEALAEAVQRGPLTPAQELLLRLSFDGSAASLEACPDLSDLFSTVHRLDMHQVLQERGGPQEPPPNPGWALRVVQLNCFSEPCMDPVMALSPLMSKAPSPAASPACADIGETDFGDHQAPASIPGTNGGRSHKGVQMLAACPALPFVRLAAGWSGSREDEDTVALGLGLGLDQLLTDSTNSAGGMARARQTESEFGGGGGDSGAGRWLQRPGHTGLWVEHAWMNHSCAPNVCNYVLGEAMVVRTSRPIRCGEEVCDSYLGSTLAAPVKVRRRALYKQYGFVCRCPRCCVEEELLGRPLAARLHVASRLVEMRVTPLAVRLMRRVLKTASAWRRGAAMGSVSGGVDQSGVASCREEVVVRGADGSEDGAEGRETGEEVEWDEEGEQEEFEEGEEADTLNARLWAEEILGGALCGATLEGASSSGTGRGVHLDAETGQRNGAPPGSPPACEGVLRDTQALGGAAGGLLSGITLINDLYLSGDGGGSGGGGPCGTLWRLALLTAALSELWAASEALVRAALLPQCRSERTDGNSDGPTPPRERVQRPGEGGDAGVAVAGSSTMGSIVQEEEELKECVQTGAGPAHLDLCVNWALFCLSGGLDLELACRRVILMVAVGAKADAMEAEAAEPAAMSKEEAVQVRNPNGNKSGSVEEGVLAALHSWCESQRREMAVRRSRLVELAAATVGGTAFHVDTTVEDWAVRRTNGSSLIDTGVTPELRYALTCRYGMLAHRETQGVAMPSCVSSSLSSPTHRIGPVAEFEDDKRGMSSRFNLEVEGQGGERDAVLLAELWLKLGH
ncbi:hypothetical protein VaNZ11_000194 [Volvox africanus]|uniref:SET domain-containing protein n=1 Tax=Volvox africanus TaxID=51714 RepID=A0ABQ5RLW0_9CHLO|nr:hypothetical protein VaNZ11_000194 [Volvox africanus]